MAVLTVRFATINCWIAETSEYILTHRYRFQVRWIDAPRITTKMVYCFTFWNRPNQSLVDKSMSLDMLPVAPENAIASIQISKPVPAFISYFNL